MFLMKFVNTLKKIVELDLFFTSHIVTFTFFGELDRSLHAFITDCWRESQCATVSYILSHDF